MKKILCKCFILSLLLSLLTGCTSNIALPSTAPADMVLTNGVIYTVDRERTTAQAVAISRGKYVYVGNNEEAKKYIGKSTEVIDLKNMMMIPSFFDGHNHGSEATDQIFGCDLSGENTIDGYLKVVEAYLIANPEATAVKGNGWSNTLFDSKGPTKEDLDGICTKLGRNVPIALWDEGHHSLWANSKALMVGNITKDTLAPEGSVIELNPETGEPSGTLRENAGDIVFHELPEFSIDQYKAGIKAYQDLAHSFGITGSFDAYLPVGSNAITAYKEMANDGELKMFIRGGYVAEPEGDFSDQMDTFIAAREKDNSGDLFKMTSIKFFEDGVIEGGTAYFSEPYAPGAGKDSAYRSKPVWELENLKGAFEKAEKADFQIHVHAIGDAATKETLDAFAYAEKQNGERDYRNAITHLQIVNPTDIQRIKKLGVIAILNPYWAIKDDYYYNLQLPYLGKDRAEKEYPVRSFFENKTVVVTASDYPITDPPNPLIAIELGITRSIPEALLQYYAEDPANPKYKEPLWPEEAAALKDLIESATYNGAYAYFLENFTGSIEVGKSADMVVLDQNLLDIPVTDISKTKVNSTFFQGKVVYQAETSLE